MQTDSSVTKQGWAVATLSALGAAIALALPVLGEALNPLGKGLAMLVSAFCLKLAAEVRQPPTNADSRPADQPADEATGDAGSSSSSSATGAARSSGTGLSLSTSSLTATDPAAELAKLAAR